MSEVKHTPGPWCIDDSNGHIYHRPAPLTKFVIAQMESGTEADERLIIAAPDMLAALHELVASSDAYDETETTEHRCRVALERARAAIAKAEAQP
jgi:hypothetical protein